MDRLLKVGNMTVGLLLACALLVLLIAMASAAPAASGASRTAQITVLSNETTYTTWALANYTARIRAQP